MAPTPRFLTLADVAEVLSTSQRPEVRPGPPWRPAGDPDRRPRAVAGRSPTELEAYIARMYDDTKAYVDTHPFNEAEARRA